MIVVGREVEHYEDHHERSAFHAWKEVRICGVRWVVRQPLPGSQKRNRERRRRTHFRLEERHGLRE